MYDYDKVGNEQEKVCFFLLYLPLSAMRLEHIFQVKKKRTIELF